MKGIGYSLRSLIQLKTNNLKVMQIRTQRTFFLVTKYTFQVARFCYFFVSGEAVGRSGEAVGRSGEAMGRRGEVGLF